MAQLEWQLTGMSNTAHVVDQARPVSKRSGRRALCGRYPSRSFEPAYAISVDDPRAVDAMPHGTLTCPECRESLNRADRVSE